MMTSLCSFGICSNTEFGTPKVAAKTWLGVQQRYGDADTVAALLGAVVEHDQETQIFFAASIECES